MPRRYRGLTLMEMLLVIGIIALIIGAVIGITMQAARIYQRTNVHISPQANVMMAFKKMEPEFRQALMVEQSSNGAMVQLTQPLMDENGYNVVVPNGDGLFVMQPGTVVTYFIGTKEQDPDDPNGWLATPIPDNQIPNENGESILYSLFRVDDSYVPVNGAYRNAPVIINDLLNDGVFESGFLYSQDAATGETTEAGEATRLIRLTLWVKVEETTPQGRVMNNQELSTKFLMRNLVVASQGP